MATISLAVAEFEPKAWLVAVTVTMSLMVVPLAVPATTCRTKVTVPVEPAGAAGAVQLIAPVPPTAGVEHVVPGGGEIETNVVCSGVVSLNDGFVAVPAPEFVAVWV